MRFLGTAGGAFALLPSSLSSGLERLYLGGETTLLTTGCAGVGFAAAAAFGGLPLGGETTLLTTGCAGAAFGGLPLGFATGGGGGGGGGSGRSRDFDGRESGASANSIVSPLILVNLDANLPPACSSFRSVCGCLVRVGLNVGGASFSAGLRASPNEGPVNVVGSNDSLRFLNSVCSACFLDSLSRAGVIP